jgi:hypothetical protein
MDRGEDDAVRDPGVGVEGLEQDGRRDRRGEIPDELRAASGPAGGLEKRREVRVEDVGLDDGHVRARLLAEKGNEGRVLLDGDDPARALREREGQGAFPRADLDDDVGRFRSDGPDDLVEDGAVDEEVLAQGVASRSYHGVGLRLRASGSFRAPAHSGA